MFISYMHCRLRVVSEVILSNLLEVSEGIYPGFETQDKRHQESKTGASLAPQKTFMSCKLKTKELPNKNGNSCGSPLKYMYSKKQKQSCTFNE